MWCKGMVMDCVTDARCLAGVILLMHKGDNTTICGKFEKIRDEVRCATASWNDDPFTTFEDVLNLTKKLKI